MNIARKVSHTGTPSLPVDHSLKTIDVLSADLFRTELEILAIFVELMRQ